MVMLLLAPCQFHKLAQKICGVQRDFHYEIGKERNTEPGDPPPILITTKAYGNFEAKVKTPPV